MFTQSIRASAPAPPKDRIAARPHEESENDQQHAEDDRARNEHHDPRDDKGYGDDPQDQTDVTTHGNPPTHAFFVSHHRYRWGDVTTWLSCICSAPPFPLWGGCR